MNPWDNFWQFFFSLPGASSPREVLLRYVLGDLLEPKQMDLYSDQYLRVLSFFATLLVPVLLLGFVVSTLQAMSRRTLLPLKQWFMGAVYVIGLLAAAPLVLTFFQYFLTLVGSGILGMLLGTDKPDGLLTILTVLPPDVNFSAALGFLETIFLLILVLELKLVVVALYASAIALMIGLALRFLPWVGEPLFAAGIKISVFGIGGYLYVMLTLAIVVGGGRALMGDTAWVTGLLNILGIGLSVVVLWRAVSSLGSQLNAVVNGAIDGYQQRFGPSSPGRGGGVSRGSQTADDAADHLKNTRHGRGSEGAPAPTSRGADPTPSKTTTQLAKEKAASGKTASATAPRASSTAARLVGEGAKKVPVPQVQAAAVAVDTAEKVSAGAATLRGLSSTQSDPVRPLAGSTTHGASQPHTTVQPDRHGSSRRLAPPTPADTTATEYQQRYWNPPEPTRQPPSSPRNRDPEREDSR